jgi:hypothetical protein
MANKSGNEQYFSSQLSFIRIMAHKKITCIFSTGIQVLKNRLMVSYEAKNESKLTGTVPVPA